MVLFMDFLDSGLLPEPEQSSLGEWTDHIELAEADSFVESDKIVCGETQACFREA